jgi:uncharacterized protein (TIGR02453 family)
MNSISKPTFKFLAELKKNNNRDWFAANKEKFEVIKSDFDTFIAALLRSIAKFDPPIGHVQPKDCIFRIYRDVRFSKDKSPYKTHLGAYITPTGKKTEVHEKAGYYIHIEPGASMLAGGAYGPEPNWLKAIRQEIDYNSEEFRKILNHKKYKTYFGTLEGEKLSRLPKGYREDHPDIELLKHKSYLSVHHLKDKDVLSETFLKHCTDVFKTMQPFNQFLNRTLD